MIARIDHLEKQNLGTIKSRRYKTMKTADKYPTGTYFTKIITTQKNQSIEWLEQEFLSRANTLAHIEHLSLHALHTDKIFQILLKVCPSFKTLILTRRYIPGFTLSEVLYANDRLNDVFNSQNARKIVWEMMGLVIAGGGFNNIIVTNDNLILEITGNNEYKPRLNYFSLAGHRLLKFGKDIHRQQYLQIAVFLDQQALETGNIDRFEFKARNFAALVLALISDNNLYNKIFDNVKLSPMISLQTAKQFLEKYVKPKLQRYIKFPSLQQNIQKLKIKGLAQFLESIFCGKKQKMENMDWAYIQNSLLGNSPSQNSESLFVKVGQKLWQKQDQVQKKRLLQKGLGMLNQKQGPYIYLAIKIGVSFEKLVSSNNWDDLVQKTGYCSWIHNFFHRFLKISLDVMKMQQKDISTSTTLPDNFNQQQSIQRRQLISNLQKIGQYALSYKTKMENREQVSFVSYQQEILNAFLS